MTPDILVKGLSSGYEAEQLARVFFPGARPRPAQAGTKGCIVYARATPHRLAVGLRQQDGRCVVRCRPATPDEDQKLALCRFLYDLLHSETGLRPPWGMLTGVRPLNLLRKKLAAGGEKAAFQHMVQLCDVQPEKYEMALDIAARQQPVLTQARDDHYSLFLSIPFCPTRCDYCSFVSRTVQREGHLLQPYLEAMLRELAETAAVAETLGLRLQSIYIGGGTPTVLSAAQLDTLLTAVEVHFDTAAVREYTVEAGRPDCTDAEKLAVLKNHGVGRISINPQTLNDEVLRRIGRHHTAADILQCYRTARNIGFACINMDLIAGLPGDDEESFANTLQQVMAFAPENITLHTLTMKRASNLAQQGAQATRPAAMVQLAYPRLLAGGWQPYYLYRQKNSVQNLENTGWATKGKEGLYNIYIMEEAHTILAVGAGATTKLVRPGEGRIKRIYNHKFPAEYVRHFDEVLARKRGVTQLYACNLDTETPC